MLLYSLDANLLTSYTTLSKLNYSNLLSSLKAYKENPKSGPLVLANLPEIAQPVVQVNTSKVNLKSKQIETRCKYNSNINSNR